MIAILFCASLNIQSENNWEPAELFDANTYQIDLRDVSGSAYSSFIRKSDNLRITLRYTTLSGDAHELFGFSEPTRSRVYSESKRTFSIGDRFIERKSQGQLYLRATTKYEFVMINVMAELENEIQPGKRLRMPKPYDFSNEIEQWENLLSETVANVAGLRANELRTITLGINTVATRFCQKSGGSFIKLTTVANLFNFQVTTNNNILELRKRLENQPQFAFATGSTQFKKGDQYVEMPDTTILINGELWVPTEVIDHF